MTSACRVIFALATSACTLPQHQARQPRTVVTTGGAVVAPYDTDFFQLPRVVIPKGFQLATGGSNSTMSKHTYLPVGALPHDWKTRFVVVTETRDAGGDLDRFLDDLQVEMRKACAGEPVVDIPQRFVDDGFPAAIQSVRCGATNDDGEARLVLYKVIVGDHVIHQMEFAWRMPAVADAASVHVPAADLEAAAASLDQAHICNLLKPADYCREMARPLPRR